MAGLPTNKELQQKIEKWMSSKNVNFLQYLTISLILAPLGVWALFINYFGVNVPYWDEWEIVKLVKNFSEHNLQISDLFVQHNEHRIFFPNLIMLALSEISGLNTQWFMYFSFFLLSLILLLLYLIFRAHFKDIPLSLIWFVPISWFIFNFAQTDLMFWGYELSIALCIFGFLVALYCLDKSEGLDIWLIFALLGGILSTFSFFNGLLVWPIGFIFIYLTNKLKTKISIAWSLLAVISYGVFFYNWVHPSYHPSVFYMFQNPISSLEYFIINVGCPLLRSDTVWTYILGAMVLLFCIIAIFYIIKYRLYQKNALYLSLLLFSLGSSFILTVGRSGFGVDQATASRYISFTLLGIVALYFIFLNLFFKSNLISKFISVFFVIITILMLIGIINAFIIGIPNAENSHSTQLINQNKLISYTTIPLDNLNTLYPDPSTVYNLSLFLDREKMSVFAPGSFIPSFPYTVIRGNESDPTRENVQLISSTMTGTDFQKSELVGYHVIGSYNTSDGDTGEVSLNLLRGDQVLYRSGPVASNQSVIIVGHEQEFITDLPIATDWVTLEFSNPKLPDEFTLIIEDNGQEWGEWSAIAIK